MVIDMLHSVSVALTVNPLDVSPVSGCLDDFEIATEFSDKPLGYSRSENVGHREEHVEVFASN